MFLLFLLYVRKQGQIRKDLSNYIVIGNRKDNMEGKNLLSHIKKLTHEKVKVILWIPMGS